jgi:putative oxidoreductase
MGFPAAPVFAVASALAESVAPAFVAIGWFARAASLVIVINMGVAFVFEWRGGDPVELPGLYLLGAVVLLISGPGAYSVDGWRRKR